MKFQTHGCIYFLVDKQTGAIDFTAPNSSDTDVAQENAPIALADRIARSGKDLEIHYRYAA